MKDYNTFVGLDAHKEKISVAMLGRDEQKPVEWVIRNEPRAIRKMVRKVDRESMGGALFCYEAGPLGYTLQRRIEERGFSCQVVAPSLIPKKPGCKVKTDRRDAHELAKLLRAGLLTEVAPPTREEESIRNLCRCRESIKRDLRRSRNRLCHFILRSGHEYYSGSRWTDKYNRWLRTLTFDQEADRLVFERYLFLVEQLTEQLRGLDRLLEDYAARDPYREMVGVLRCFRGIDTVTAMTIASELYCFGRFATPDELMSFLGLTPSEYSTSNTRRQGSITKSGNAHVRRVLIEAAWHYRHRPALGAQLKKRRRGQPASAISIADKAQQRLYRRFWMLVNKGKEKNKAAVAVARELVGFIWSALYDPESAESM